MIKIGVFCLLLLVGQLQALSLEQALKQAKPLSFDADKQQLVVRQQQLESQQIKANDDYEITLNTQLGLREQYSEQLADNRLYLNIYKTIFSSNQAADSAFTKSGIAVEKMRLTYLKSMQKIMVMQAFFAGVLADLEYDYLTQVLALSAVSQRHTEEDEAVGYATEVEVLKKRAQTQADFNQRLWVENKQVLTRQNLADLLDIPDERPDELEYPPLNEYLNYALDNEQHQQQLLKQNNSLLNILKQEIANLTTKKQYYTQSSELKLDTYLRLGEQSYNKDKEGNYRAGIVLNIPFGDSQDEQQIEALAILIAQKKIELKQQQETLSSESLNLFLKLKALKQQHQSLRLEQDYLQFNLDKASLEYEMRLARNIGNAMVLVTKNDLERARIAFEMALTIEQLSLLTH